MGWKQPLPQTKVKNTLKLGCKSIYTPLSNKTWNTIMPEDLDGFSRSRFQCTGSGP
jgi:hypothetical protein